MSYKTVALKAAELSAEKKVNPVEAWERCAKSEYPNSPTEEKGDGSRPGNGLFTVMDKRGK